MKTMIKIAGVMFLLSLVFALYLNCGDAVEKLEDLTGLDLIEDEMDVKLTGNSAFLYLRRT